MGIQNTRANGQCPVRLRARRAAVISAAFAALLVLGAADAGAQTQADAAAGALAPAPWPAALRAPASLSGAAAVPADQEGSRRQTWRGAKIGAVAGGLAGLGVGGFITLWCRAEGSPCDAALPILTLGGVASGAVAGAIIGAAVPRHAESVRTVPPVERRIGSASVSAGVVHVRQTDYADRRMVDGTGPAARINLYAELRPWLALGPEAGIAWVGDTAPPPLPDSGDPGRLSGGGQLRHAALAIRLSGRRGRLAPYAGGNIGAYQTTGPSLEFLGGAVMAGARWTPGSGRGFIDVDMRYGGNLQNIEPMRFAGVHVGGGIYW